MNIWAIITATFVAFVASALYYVIFAKQRAKVSPAAASTERPPAWQMVAELLRNVVLALILAYLVDTMNINGAGNSVILGLLLWVGFPLILLSGSIMYEKAPVKLALIHAGDWLIKLLLMVVIIASWR